MITTKEQELKALEKIEKIVAELGEGSYVATAFEGCFDMARQNIENDWACSWKQVADSNVKASEAQQEEIVSLNKEIDKLVGEGRDLRDRLDEAQAELERRVSGYESDICFLSKQLDKAHADTIAARRDIRIDAGDDWNYFGPFKAITFYRNEGSFPFINVVEPSGWTRSYKIDDLKELTIE